MKDQDIITMEPVTDPRTGDIVYAAVPRGDSVITDMRQPIGGTMTDPTQPRIVDGELATPAGDPVARGQAITLTDDRFAGDRAFDWGRAEQAQDAGHMMQIIDGELVPVGTKPNDPGQSVTLTGDRFAAVAVESTEIARLVRSGTASTLIADLRPTSEIASHFTTDPGGWYLRTKPTPSYRDVLHTVIRRRSATGLYHAYLWQFMQFDRGELKKVDLNRWVGSHETLSAHNIHLYSGHNGEAAVLCLSQRTIGGMPDLTGAVLQAAKWADGMGYVVRGRKFPYRQ